MPQPAHETGRHVIERERDALTALLGRMPEIADAFDDAVERMLGCAGRVVVCGMGKSGQIGRKIASTLVSTGTPASFLHPAEGFHGDVGLVAKADLVVAISNSGETRELLDLMPVIRNLGAQVVALTGPADSKLAQLADVVISWGNIREADGTGLVPTVSAALTLALGDALTVAVMKRRGFTAGEYRLFHPHGAIGTKLSLRVIDLLRGPDTNPCVAEDATLAEALDVITRHTRGGVNVIDGDEKLVGILTDGDVRRLMVRAEGTISDLMQMPVREVMTAGPRTTRADTLAIDALREMEARRPGRVYVLPVVDAEGRAVGMIHMHTLVQAGLTPEEGGEQEN